MEEEIWRDVVGYEGYYQVSNLGRVKSLSRVKMIGGLYPIITNDRILKPCLDHGGYKQLGLYKNGKKQNIKIHQLVAITFLGHKRCGYRLVIDHINDIKTDNRVENLRIVTPRENSNRKHIGSYSNHLGVDRKNNKWRSRIVVDGKSVHLGMFNDEIEASEAYQKALMEINNGLEISSKPKEKIKTSIYKGVHLNSSNNKWIAKIRVNGSSKYIGAFDCQHEANKAKIKFLDSIKDK